jgi:phospholipase C
MNSKIKHVFVVMFENRSFDHMLGFSKITGTDAKTGQPTQIAGIDNPEDYREEYPIGSGNYYQPEPGAPYSLSFDPPHEYIHTFLSLTGGSIKYQPYNYPPIINKNFVGAYAQSDEKYLGANMKCFTEDQLPVLHQLAKEFAVCDHWLSSVPGPTWPNRFFLHAATSGGLDDSPTKTVIKAADFKEEFNFENGTIFDRLEQKGIPWRIYEGDEFSQSYALKGMAGYSEKHIRPYKQFKKDIGDPNFDAAYTFIEPSYGYVITNKGSFKCGNSQHPLDDVRRGELLLKDIYEAIRNSPHWESSCLVVTYDEHGGFFDHVVPPKATPPGDKEVDPSYNQHGFTFDQLGIRVPTVIISPLIPKNTIDHTTYDHTSLLKTLELWLQLEPLTNRDRSAVSFEHLLSLETPRGTPKSLNSPKPFVNLECNKCWSKIENILVSLGLKGLKDLERSEISGTTAGFLHLAFFKKMHHTPENEKPQVIDEYNNLANKKDAFEFIEKTRDEIKTINQKKSI